MILEPADSADGEDIVAGREEDREKERRGRARVLVHQSEDRKDNRKGGRHYGSELRALPKWDRDEERPASQCKAKEEVDDEDKAHVRPGKNAIVPDERDTDPGGEVRKRRAGVQRDDACRVQQSHSLHVAGEQTGPLPHEGSRYLVRYADEANN